MKKKQKLVSVWEKIGYSFGDFASNLFWMMFVFYGMFFYTDVFGIPAAAVGTMFFITKFWDAVNDPLMGIIADRTETKWGKYRPFLIWIVIPFAIIGVLAFTTPNFNISGKIIYAYVTYTLLMMAYTAINIPYSALMGVLTPNSEERTSISSYRFVAAFTGGLFIQALTLPLVGLYGGGAHSVIAVDIQSGHQIVIQEQGVGTSQLRVTIDRKQSEEELKKLSWLSDIFGGDKKIVKDKIVWVNTPEILSEVDTTDGNLYFIQGFQQKRLDLVNIFPEVNWDEVDYTIATINQRKGFQFTIGTYALIAIVFFMLTFLMTK
ncbi:MAG: MFS transporter, partial [bacterium]